MSAGTGSDGIVLELRAPLDRPVDADGLIPDHLARLGARELAELRLWSGRDQVALGEIFHIRGTGSNHVRIEGDLRQLSRLGAGMASGTLVVAGDAGDGVGQAMRGGTIVVEGSAGGELGGSRPGASRGMTGGEIIVRGNSGPNTGARMRRGLIVVGGDAGAHAALGSIAGTVIVFGTSGHGAARGAKRGTLVAMGSLEVPPTFRYACTYRPPHLRLTLTYLRRRHGVPIDDRQITGTYHRYSGDLAELGRGEILQWTGS